MTDTPWLGDACSLVDAFRNGERSPAEELEASLAAIEASSINSFSNVFADEARAVAATADTSLPFGGVTMGVKELTPVASWPHTGASLVFADRVAEYDATMISRLQGAGAVLAGQTTASEFGGLNVSTTKLNGVTGNPWDPTKTAGGSSGGSAAAVAAGLVPIATGGDGGGSIRIPAGFNGLLGFKGTAGRIPRGPQTQISPMTVVVGCLARSVRDTARWLDVCAGYDGRDPYSLPKIDGWERDLGSHALAGRRVAIVPDLNCAVVRPEVAARVAEAAEALAADAGLTIVDVVPDFPSLGLEWAVANLVQLNATLGERWPECAEQLTDAIRGGMEIVDSLYSLDVASKAEMARTQANEAMAAVFDQVDFLICATNPDVAYPAHVTANTRVGTEKVGLENNGRLTIPANITGNPAVSVPVPTVEGLPVGMQIIGRHHEDQLLLDLARTVEQHCPWPLVAPGAPT